MHIEHETREFLLEFNMSLWPKLKMAATPNHVTRATEASRHMLKRTAKADSCGNTPRLEKIQSSNLAICRRKI